VLKDAFDLGLDEIAEILSTSAGAVRAALHRGRAKLTESDPGCDAHAGARGGAPRSAPRSTRATSNG
jgi:RNA polymerase sigma-70 factor (ECF subfamily)